MPFYVGDTILISVDGVVDHIAGSPITNATVSATLKDSGGTTIGSDTLTHIGDGSYRGAITATMTVGATYTLEVTVSATMTGGRTLNHKWKISDTAQERTT